MFSKNKKVGPPYALILVILLVYNFLLTKVLSKFPVKFILDELIVENNFVYT